MNLDEGLTVRVRRHGVGWRADCALPPAAGAARTVAGALTGLAGALALHYEGQPGPPVVVVAGVPLRWRLAGLACGWRRLLALDVVGTAAVLVALSALYERAHGGNVAAVLQLAVMVVPVALVALNVPTLWAAISRAPWNLVRRDALPQGLDGNGCALGR